jgi:glycosyltransferase involved in cell wall biosynthesis
VSVERLKILHILSTPRAEGTPNLVLDWLKGTGQKQDVFVLNSTPADLTARLRNHSGWYGESDLFSGHGLGKLLKIAFAVRRACRERRPNVIICWPTGFANWICLGARLALGPNVRLLVHCGNPPRRGAVADWMTWTVMLPVQLLGGYCVCCSNYVRDSFRIVPGLLKSRFQTVYNGVRVSEIRERATPVKRTHRSEPSGIMVGTMEPHKDHATLLRAMPEVLASCPTFRLLLAGDGSLRAKLEQLARDLGVDYSIDFLGSRTDVAELLRTADLFIFATTENEGFGTALIEALVAGLPVVASDCPACRETLANGAYGRLVAPKDPSTLARGIVSAITKTPPLIDDDALSKYLDQFTIQRMISGYLELTQR